MNLKLLVPKICASFCLFFGLNVFSQAAPTLVANENNNSGMVISDTVNGGWDNFVSSWANLYASVWNSGTNQWGPLLNSGNNNTDLAFSVNIADGTLIGLRHRHYNRIAGTVSGFEIISGDGTTKLYDGTTDIVAGTPFLFTDPHDNTSWKLTFTAATTLDSQDLVSNISATPDSENDRVDTLLFELDVPKKELKITLPSPSPEVTNEQPTTFNVQLKNEGNTDLTVSNAQLAGADAGAFSIQTSLASPIVIAANATTNLSVQFTPTVGEKRRYYADLTITSDDTTTPNKTVEITARSANPQQAPATAPILVVHAHPDDEGLFGGGVIPFYSQVRGYPVIVVSMVTRGSNGAEPLLAGNGTDRLQELRNSMDVYGGQTIGSGLVNGREYTTGYVHQVQGGFIDTGCCGADPDDSWSEAGDNQGWGTSPSVTQVTPGFGNLDQVSGGRDAAARQVARQIRKYKPLVVVSVHDLEGDYGHSNHSASAVAAIDGYTLAGNSSVNIDGLAAWTPKKLYLRGNLTDNRDTITWGAFSSNGGINALFHDFFEDPSINSQSPRFVAREGIRQHASQGGNNSDFIPSSIHTSGRFSGHHTEWWTLYSSTVGADTSVADFTITGDLTNTTYSGWARGDFFEGVAVNLDGDGDGMPDAWEMEHFRDEFFVLPNDDRDNDGISNLNEYVSGTDPNVADSNSPQILAGTTIQFTVPTATGSGYDKLDRKWELRWSPDLQDWSTLIASGTGNGTQVQHTIGSQSEGNKGFYRLTFSLQDKP